MEAVITMTPRSPSTGLLPSIAAATRRSTLKVPTRLMSMTFRKSSRFIGPFLPTTRPGVPTPAQLTTTRKSPSSWAAEIAACTWLWSRTSAAQKRTLSPSSLARVSPGDEGRSTMTTAAPPSCSRRVVASPRPEAPPVTSATVETLICKGFLLGGWSAAEQLAGDDEPLDLVGAFKDLGDLGFAHIALRGEVTGVAGATEHLDGISGDLHGRVGADELGDGGLLAEVPAGVLEPGRMQIGRPRRRDGRLHVRKQESKPLKLADGLAELLTLLAV